MIVINWSGVILDDPSLFNTIDVRNELIVVGIQNKPFKTTIKETTVGTILIGLISPNKLQHDTIMNMYNAENMNRIPGPNNDFQK